MNTPEKIIYWINSLDNDMVNPDQIQKYNLGYESLKYILEDAKAACLGGQSHIRNGQNRQDELWIDQMVGLIGNYVVAVWRDGDARAYHDQRHSQNRFSTVGDAGYDLPRCRVDVKSSLMRYSQDPMNYRLLVRPRERHQGWVYICVLIGQFDLNDIGPAANIPVYIAGWLKDHELPAEPDQDGPFKGAFAVPVPQLHPIMPLFYEISFNGS